MTDLEARLERLADSHGLIPIEHLRKLLADWDTERRTVTPEQIEATAQRMYASFHDQAAESGHQPTPYDYEPWGHSSVVTKFWLEVARAGLSVDGAEHEPELDAWYAPDEDEDGAE